MAPFECLLLLEPGLMASMLAPSVLTSGVAAEAKELDRIVFGFRAGRGGDAGVEAGEDGNEVPVVIADVSSARVAADLLAAFRREAFWGGSRRLGMLIVLW